MEAHMFVGRVNEIKSLLKTFEIPSSHAIVYGNRRVGKTELVTESAKRSGLTFVSFECLKSSLQSNLNAFSRLLLEEGILPSSILFSSFLDLFAYLNSLNRHLIILVDEYPYLYYKNDKNEIDSEFQTILGKISSNLNIVISGSHIGMMKELLMQKNPIFGRAKTIIHLTELNYQEASEFYPNATDYDKVAFYGVFGGSPFVLKQLDPNKGVEENIAQTILNPMSSVFSYVSELYTTDLSIKDSANAIFEAIGNSSVRHNRIEEKLHLEHNGLLSKQLKVLLDMEFIEKNTPINRLGDAKKTSYFIKNNALRFYFTYIYGRQNILGLLGPEEFFNRYINESLVTFLSHRFEEIVRSYFSIEVRLGRLNGILNIGTYYYDDSKKKKNGEFDVALKREGGFDLIEVKFLKGKVTREMVEIELKQIASIEEIGVKRVGFASINGFEDDVKGLAYQIEGKDLFPR